MLTTGEAAGALFVCATLFCVPTIFCSRFLTNLVIWRHFRLVSKFGGSGCAMMVGR